MIYKGLLLISRVKNYFDSDDGTQNYLVFSTNVQIL